VVAVGAELSMASTLVVWRKKSAASESAGAHRLNAKANKTGENFFMDISAEFKPARIIVAPTIKKFLRTMFPAVV
jgi:hypothetical protein